MGDRVVRRWTAFEGFRRIASGEPAEVATKTKDVLDRGGRETVLIFDDETGEQVDIDFRGMAEDVVRRLTKADETAHSGSESPRGPGRPKLGVVAREVTLLPRHWEWLNGQPGGASVALRKLVEQARRANEGKDRLRRSQEAAYRFMSSLAGNLPGFEESARALFRGDPALLDEHTRDWPEDVRAHLLRLAHDALRSEVMATTLPNPTQES